MRRTLSSMRASVSVPPSTAAFNPSNASCKSSGINTMSQPAAIAAGCDMVLMPEDLQEAFDGLKAAVEGGTLTEARIDESVRRILTVKAAYGLLKD